MKEILSVRKDAEVSARVGVDYPAVMGGEHTAFLFVGQGTRISGAEAVYQRSYIARGYIDHLEEELLPALGVSFSLKEVSFTDKNGLLKDGKRTDVVQLVTHAWNMANVLALVEAVGQTGKEFILPGKLAGFSLGELAALEFSGAVETDEMIKFIVTRGREMQKASEAFTGGKIVLRISPRTYEESPSKDQRSSYAKAVRLARKNALVIATVNSDSTLSVGGTLDAITHFKSQLEERRQLSQDDEDYISKDIQTIDLAVAGAFHTPYMGPAVPGVVAYVSKMRIKDPRVPIISNVTGNDITNAYQVKSETPRHLQEMVKWSKTKRRLERYNLVAIGDYSTSLLRQSSREGIVKDLVTPNGIVVGKLLETT